MSNVWGTCAPLVAHLKWDWTYWSVQSNSGARAGERPVGGTSPASFLRVVRPAPALLYPLPHWPPSLLPFVSFPNLRRSKPKCPIPLQVRYQAGRVSSPNIGHIGLIGMSRVFCKALAVGGGQGGTRQGAASETEAEACGRASHIPRGLSQLEEP